MKELIQSQWSQIIDILVRDHEISPVAASTFIEPLEIASIDGDDLTFYVGGGSRGIDFIKHKFYDVYLAIAIEQVTGKKYNITFTDTLTPPRRILRRPGRVWGIPDGPTPSIPLG